MTAQLNHTIVWCRDKAVSARFYEALLGLPPAAPFSHFLVLQMDNRVSLDLFEKEGDIALQHYAFLVSDEQFDATMSEIAARGLDYWADPARTKPGEINRHWGGRGVYFPDPNGHLLEAITTPYGAEEDA